MTALQAPVLCCPSHTLRSTSDTRFIAHRYGQCDFMDTAIADLVRPVCGDAFRRISQDDATFPVMQP